MEGVDEVIIRMAAVLTVLVCLFGFGGGRASAFPGGDAAGALMIGGMNRTYQVHAPAGLDRPAGLVLNLHGAGMTGPAQAAATNYNAIADQYGFVVAYPEGVDLSWADGRGASIPDRQGVDDVGFLVALVDRLRQEYGVEPGRVFATGTSAGAFMASRLACERADVFAAVAPVAGTLPAGFPCAPSQPVSVLEVHGTADPVVPFGGGPMVGRGGPSEIVAAPAMAQRWRELNGCPPPVDEVRGSVHRFTAAGCAGGTEVVFVQIDGGAHVWPSGPFAPFDASQSTGQFFATHGR
ncbi:extracellular catalytic domain type 1 short-chain-length polyhydroxyalkanoate depolymerase [Mycolicibacterium celeriflavum]|uniref:Esterase n=2 Tax=Mycolicibacterium celeriflavum TaxID=1249101 RepID=A0A1X0BX78_MYCCF|nr:PHB depolymerase family esterase [Mycolicibacterium celeriflavum]MCV7240694.1 prolyl oligopeptidase family serine peptidase [Mycolicibacterium celeriflavum]ORA48162.1 esterase [Mycolicibacterium celeriflavum]BBY43543.1 esterase [Mycolicibacterium celeriflavum]